MRNILKIFILFALALINISCEDAFQPKEEFKERYVLYSVIEKDNFYWGEQYSVRIFRSYDVDGYDPNTNNIDPTIQGAEVTYIHNNQNYAMEQDTIIRQDTSRYRGPIYSYRTKDFFRISPKEKAKIIAKLPNGTILTAETVLPNDLNIEYSYDFPRGLTSHINTSTFGKQWTVFWDNGEQAHLFFPRLRIFYQKYENETWNNYYIDVPSTYSSGKPVYVSYTFDTKISYDFSALDQTMRDISGNDTAKSNYKVVNAMLEIRDYNEPLSKYFSSINGSLDAFSVRLDETVYSNVSGGLGVFGSFIKNQRELQVDLAYIKSFGYVH
ncbi:MAG TPA: DUF4249 family protein [Ignavibacteriaceae bacterium]|nr:DUF4249 family protein [Ignavibacteriaceae bacterium]